MGTPNKWKIKTISPNPAQFDSVLSTVTTLISTNSVMRNIHAYLHCGFINTTFTYHSKIWLLSPTHTHMRALSCFCLVPRLLHVLVVHTQMLERQSQGLAEEVAAKADKENSRDKNWRENKTAKKSKRSDGRRLRWAAITLLYSTVQWSVSAQSWSCFNNTQ